MGSADALHVVVVDDDPLVLAVARRVVARAGYTVSIFEDIQSALLAISSTRPFAVVADLNMPGMSGADLLRLVAELSPQSFRLLYTGESSASELAQTMTEGLAHAIVSKAEGPRSLPEALDAVRRSLPA